MNSEQIKGVRRLLSGGLWTDNNEDGIRVKDAAVRVAAAQLRAIRFALAADDSAEAPNSEDGRQGWTFGDQFDRADAILALGGVQTLLDNAAWLADEADTDECRIAVMEAAEVVAAQPETSEAAQ